MTVPPAALPSADARPRLTDLGLTDLAAHRFAGLQPHFGFGPQASVDLAIQPASRPAACSAGITWSRVSGAN